MHADLLARWLLAKTLMGRLTSPTMGWCSLSFDLHGAHVVMKVFLTSRMKNMWPLYLLSGQVPPPPCYCYYLYLGVSVQRGWTPDAQSGECLSPDSIWMGMEETGRVVYPNTDFPEISGKFKEYQPRSYTKGRGTEASQSREGKRIIELVCRKVNLATTSVFLAGELEWSWILPE